MKVKVLYDENCFLFDDEEGNKILVKGKKEKSEFGGRIIFLTPNQL